MSRRDLVLCVVLRRRRCLVGAPPSAFRQCSFLSVRCARWWWIATSRSAVSVHVQLWLWVYFAVSLVGVASVLARVAAAVAFLFFIVFCFLVGWCCLMTAVVLLLEAILVGLVARDLPFSVVLFMAVWWL